MDEYLCGDRPAGRSAFRQRLAVLLLSLWLAIGGFGLAASPAPAEAGDDFCAGDPIIAIGSDMLTIIVQIPRSKLSFVTASNPVVVQVSVPPGVTAQQVSYTGIVPEIVQLIPNQSVNGSSNWYNIPVKVTAPPDPSGASYPVIVTATSSIDSATTLGVSGSNIVTPIKVAK